MKGIKKVKRLGNRKSVKQLLTVTMIGALGFTNAYATDHFTMRTSTLMQRQMNLEKQGRDTNSALKLSPVMYVNKQDGIMAFAADKKQAKALSAKAPQVYYLIKGDTVSQTIKRWGTLNGYTVFFQSDDDYQVQTDSIIYGSFLGHGGALSTLLDSLKSASMPFKAEVMANKVILIKPGTFSSSFLTPQ
ncbi:TcpQ domain-containing protein [Cysteiniphilum litorale]